MDSRTGKHIRLGRILQPCDGRGVVVATSHGVLTGPPGGQRTLAEIAMAFAALGAADAVMVAPGMLRIVEDFFVGRGRPGVVIEMDWKSWNRPIYPPLSDGRSEGAVGSLARLEDLAAAGVDGIMSYLYVGQLDQRLEREEITRNALLARECARWGVALIIEPRSAREGQEDDATSAQTLSFYARVSAELGADIVKCVWPGSPEALAEVTASCYVPVLLAGGPGGDDVEATISLATRAMAAGAAGVMFGRRIYRSPDPALTLKRVVAAVHERPCGSGCPEHGGRQ